MFELLNPTIKYFVSSLAGKSQEQINFIQNYVLLIPVLPRLKAICDRTVYVLTAMNGNHIKGIKTVS